MNTVTLIGIDLGKHCFHLHGQDAQGRMVFRKKLSRSQMLTQLANFPVCRVVMEACAGAHWIARRELCSRAMVCRGGRPKNSGNTKQRSAGGSQRSRPRRGVVG